MRLCGEGFITRVGTGAGSEEIDEITFLACLRIRGRAEKVGVFELAEEGRTGRALVLKRKGGVPLCK